MKILSGKILTALFLILLFAGCKSASEDKKSLSDHSIKETLQTKQSEKHGMLAAPVFDVSLKELNQKDIRLKPVIAETLLRGGRYFDPCFISDSSFAVACLRGIDVFTVSSEKSLLEPDLQIDTPGHAWSVVKVKDYIWVADGYAGVLVLDPVTGKKISSFPELSNARSFHVMSDGGVIVCRHSSGADIIYSGDGRTIERRITLDVSDRVFSASSDQEHVFLGTLGGGFIAYKSTGNGHYERVWTFTGCHRILSCLLTGKYHILIDRDAGLRILSRQKSGTPLQIGFCELKGQWRRAVMKDSNTILAAHESGLLEVDISDPGKPVIVNRIKSSLDSRGVAVRDNSLVLTESEYGLKLIDLSRGKPVISAEYIHNGLVSDIAIDDIDLLLTQTHRGLHRFKIKKRGSATILDPYKIWNDGQYLNAVDISGSLIAVADYKGFVLLESKGGKPVRQLSRMNTPGRAVNVAIKKNLLFVSDWFEGLRIFDISDPADPIFLSRVETTGWVIDALVSDNHVYACAVNQGLLTIDISDPKQPKITDIDTSAQAPEGIASRGNCLYLADFNFGLIVYNLADPAEPSATTCWKMAVCKGVQVKENTLILCNYIYGLKWFDITNPMQPVLIGELDTPGKSYEVVFGPEENSLFVADWHEFLKVTW